MTLFSIIPQEPNDSVSKENKQSKIHQRDSILYCLEMFGHKIFFKKVLNLLKQNKIYNFNNI